MAHPTFGATGDKIDFGFDNDDADDFRSVVRIVAGPVEKRRAEFAFPGIDGVSVQLLGIGPRTIVWMVTVAVKDEDEWTTLETSLNDHLKAGRPYEMTYHGKTLDNVELVDWFETLPAHGLAGAWVGVKFYQLVFRDLTP